MHSTLRAGERYTSLDLTVKFLRPVTVDSGRAALRGLGHPAGPPYGARQAQLFDAADRLVAHATSTCMIFTPS